MARKRPISMTILFVLYTLTAIAAAIQALLVTLSLVIAVPRVDMVGLAASQEISLPQFWLGVGIMVTLGILAALSIVGLWRMRWWGVWMAGIVLLWDAVGFTHAMHRIELRPSEILFFLFFLYLVTVHKHYFSQDQSKRSSSDEANTSTVQHFPGSKAVDNLIFD